MTVRTASLRELKSLSKTTYKILVMRYYPWYYKGIKKLIDEWLPILAPSEELLKDYLGELKKVKNPRLAWNLVKYENRFRREILSSSEALGELRRIKRKGRELKGKRVVYLICKEPTDEYCHRRLLIELMRYDFGN